MKIISDSERYDDLQMKLLEEIILGIRKGLRSAGIKDGRALSEATGDIAFSVATIIDGSRVMECEGQPLVPVLTFATERNGDTLIVEPDGSWMHEYAFGAADDIFGQDGE